MKRFRRISWLLMAFALLALPACSGAAAPTVDTGPVFTQIAVTAFALQTQVAQQQAVPTATSAPVVAPTFPPIPTLATTKALLATDTPLPTSTSTAAPVVVYTAPVSSGTITPAPVGPVPSMSVTLVANDVSTYSATVPEDQILIFRAHVENGSFVPLQVTANLAVPDGWGVSQDTFSDCPTESPLLGHKDTCTISWYFNPMVTGQVYLRVYVRGNYTDTAGNPYRIASSPSFIVNVVP